MCIFSTSLPSGPPEILSVDVDIDNKKSKSKLSKITNDEENCKLRKETSKVQFSPCSNDTGTNTKYLFFI